jgi:hypothetical protein
MPVLSALFASVIEGSTTSATFTAVASTDALANQTTYLVLVTANAIAGSNNTPVEAEATFGSTRYGFTRYQVPFNGAPDSASGGQIAGAFVVTGNGTDRVAVNLRRISGAGTAYSTAHIACIPISSLPENTYWWRSEAANTDCLSIPDAGAGWIGSGQRVDVTPRVTGNFLIIAALEAEFTRGHTNTDQARMRCRVTEDLTGTPRSWNLQDNLANAIDGPETRVEGGSSWGNYALSQRFVDVLALTSGTTYRFEPEWEGVTGGGHTGYRRTRVYVFDLSVWPAFAFSRDVDGQTGQDQTFAPVTTNAPPSALDYVLLGSVAHCNNNAWIRTHFDENSTGTPTRLPSSAGFGMALIDTGNTTTDDYALIGLQWHRAAVSVAQHIAMNCEADRVNCRWSHEIGVYPGGIDDGVAALTIIWGMETSGGSSGSPITGSASGASTVNGALYGTAAIAGTSIGACFAAGTLNGSDTASGTAAGVATVVGTLAGAGALAGTAIGTSTAMLAFSHGALLGPTASLAFVGNSYTQNYNSLPSLLEFYLGQRLEGSAVSLGPPPHLETSIANRADGYFTGMSLGGMALYPTIDQSSAGSTDAVDAILSAPSNAYDYIVLTSGFRQDQRNIAAGIDYEMLPGAGGANPNLYGVILEIKRRIVLELATGGSTAGIICRMTQEGTNANADENLDRVERIVRLQVLGARQLQFEGIVDIVVPEHYVWSRLQWGAFGPVGSTPSDAVPAFVNLTHGNSLQPFGRNCAWLNRSQGDQPPFNRNGHQNAIATIVHVWTWGYALWGLDPRGDATFSSPSGLPTPFDQMIRSDGLRIYGGHNTGFGNLPYDTTANPGGPPDSELDLDWSIATQQQIQERIVAAIDDYNAGQTEFDAATNS